MNHEQIDQFNLIDRYLMRKLTADESADFEEHFVDCPQCVARLQMTKSFLQDLRLVAAEPAAQIVRRRPRWSWPRYLHRLPYRPVALAIACLLIIAIATAIYVVHYTRRLQTELDQATRLSEQWERRYENERESALEANRRREAAESRQSEQLSALEAKLKAEEALRTQKEAEVSPWMHPAGNLPIFPLVAVRGSESSGSEAINRITVPASSQMFLLSISLDEATRFGRYRMTIFDARHRQVWASRALKPDQENALAIPFRADFFRPGRYSLILEGIKKGSGREMVGQFPLLIKRDR